MSDRALTWDEAAEVRRLNAGGVSQAGLARLYGVSPASVSFLIAGMTYRRECQYGERLAYVTAARDHIEPMPCSLNQRDHGVMGAMDTATPATAAASDSQSAAWPMARDWQPDDAYTRIAAAWHAGTLAPETAYTETAV